MSSRFGQPAGRFSGFSNVSVQPSPSTGFTRVEDSAQSTCAHGEGSVITKNFDDSPSTAAWSERQRVDVSPKNDSENVQGFGIHSKLNADGALENKPFGSSSFGRFESGGDTVIGSNFGKKFGAIDAGEKRDGFKRNEFSRGFGQPPSGVFGRNSAGSNGQDGFGQRSSFEKRSDTGFGNSNSETFGSGSGFGERKGGFGSSNSGTFGSGGGFGERKGGFGSSNSGTFGSGGGFGERKGGFGFGSKNEESGRRESKGFFGSNEEADNADMDSKPTTFRSTGFGGKFDISGFSNERSGFGTKSFGDSNADSGFGSKFGKSFGGGFGDEAPRNRGGGSNGGCYKCGEAGHFARECPQAENEQPSRSLTCRRCGEEGHFARECPQSDSGFSQKSSSCYKCGEPGHIARECPQSEDGQLQRPSTCHKCGESGHFARECTQPDDGQAGRFGSNSYGIAESDSAVRVPSTYVPKEPDVESIFTETTYSVGINFENLFEADVRGSRESREVMLTAYKSFAEAGISPAILDNVVKAGYQKMTPIQQYVMPLIAEGRDVMGCAPTGCGKTAAFLLPIMSALIDSGECSPEAAVPVTPRCIIVSPTRELARQIYCEAVKFGSGTPCKAGIIYGGTSCSFQQQQLQYKSCAILVATIGRLLHFIGQELVSLTKLKYIVIDEADRMLDMSFDSDLSQILMNPDVDKSSLQTLMFSATFPVEVQRLAEKHLKRDFTKVTVDQVGAANKCILQRFIEVSPDEKKNRLLELLDIDIKSYKVEGDAIFKQKTLVFVNTRRLADTLGGVLCQSGLQAMTIHGLRYQGQREEALHLFRTGKTPVLVATAVAERGLDISNVDHVINYDMPKDREEYVHRIGRTGRVGNVGRATSFYNPIEDQPMASELVSVLREVQQEPPDFLLRDARLAPEISFGFGTTSLGIQKS